jgi:hypothetical protein
MRALSTLTVAVLSLLLVASVAPARCCMTGMPAACCTPTLGRKFLDKTAGAPGCCLDTTKAEQQEATEVHPPLSSDLHQPVLAPPVNLSDSRGLESQPAGPASEHQALLCTFLI